MTKEKLLLFTFDYELFLGDRSGSVQECLITPTDILLSYLDKYSFKGYFFVDTVYLLQLRDIAREHELARADFDRIMTQLIHMAESGHDIYPHIHPHWMDAVYDPTINQWCLSEKRYYKFSSLPAAAQMDLFERSFRLLRGILDRTGRNQPVDCYRAGGWSIQPFIHFRPMFLIHGVKHEFSVVPGKYQFSDAQSFDFREAPQEDSYYRFDKDACKKDEGGPFTEWTISSLVMNRYEQWANFKIGGMLKRLGKIPPHKGVAIASVINREGDDHTHKGRKRVIASFEGLNPFTLRKYFSAIDKTDYFHFISHPKLLSPYENKMTEKLFRALKRKYEIETDFRKVAS